MSASRQSKRFKNTGSKGTGDDLSRCFGWNGIKERGYNLSNRNQSFFEKIQHVS